MKTKVLILIAAVMAISFSANAQNQQRQGERQQVTPKQRAEQMAKALELTPEQTTKVEAIFTDQQAKMAELRQQGQNTDPQARREQMQQLREKYDAELEKVIGKEKLEKWRTAQREQMRERGGQQGQGNRPQRQQ